MKFKKSLLGFSLIAGILASGLVMADKGSITPELKSVEVMHNGKPVTISRSTAKDARIPDAFAKTSKGCPPFCIQPMHVAPDVETIGELELLEYLKTSGSDSSVMVVDSRTPDWVQRGTIPGSVNIPWNQINHDVDGFFESKDEVSTLNDVLIKQFGVTSKNDTRDFTEAKTLVLFCNGIWCPQSTANIKTLIKLGYPADKLKWYRGGMQSWVDVGLTTVTP